ncbi:MAG: putative DNA binding domain-containing protein [Bacteroidales bacterium]|nr:putative DNA binding domain-containing protein [Bacteroidales bacterium]MCF8337521.1 putative DNA binding domain-containing protein [Bacteroidales bacterium]
MKYNDLLEILSNPENYYIEFKRDDVRPEHLAKEIVAFANFRGGQVILGVDDNTKEIVGLTRDNCEEWVMDTVFNRYITPSIIPLYEEINTPEGHKVAVITIEQGTLKPYAVKQNNRETIYIRIGSISKIADRDQMLRMSQEVGHYHFEIAPVSGTSIKDLDKELFIEFYKKTYDEKVSFDIKDKDLEDLLSGYDLMVQSSFGEKVCSIAGLILFGKNPAKFLPQHGIRVLHYKGDEISFESVSDKNFTAPIGRILKDNELERSGLVDHVMQHLSEKLSEEKMADDGITRIRNWVIPERVLREVIVNSIIHRDYTRSGKNEIRLFDNRIEFESQGRLPNTLTIDKIKAGQKYPRNPLLVQHAQYLGLMEHKGLGIRKIVIEKLKNMGFPEPELIETDEFFKVIIKKKV